MDDNPWKKHLQKTQRQNKHLSLKECMQLASSTYSKSKSGPGGNANRKKKGDNSSNRKSASEDAQVFRDIIGYSTDLKTVCEKMTRKQLSMCRQMRDEIRELHRSFRQQESDSESSGSTSSSDSDASGSGSDSD